LSSTIGSAARLPVATSKRGAVGAEGDRIDCLGAAGVGVELGQLAPIVGGRVAVVDDLHLFLDRLDQARLAFAIEQPFARPGRPVDRHRASGPGVESLQADVIEFVVGSILRMGHVNRRGAFRPALAKQVSLPRQHVDDRMLLQFAGAARDQLAVVGTVPIDGEQAAATAHVTLREFFFVGVIYQALVVDPKKLSDVEIGKHGHHLGGVGGEVDHDQRVALAGAAQLGGQRARIRRQLGVRKRRVPEEVLDRRWRGVRRRGQAARRQDEDRYKVAALAGEHGDPLVYKQSFKNISIAAGKPAIPAPGCGR
jgi:hypothetical protein